MLILIVLWSALVKKLHVRITLMKYPNLLNLNVYDKLYKDKFLIMGTCIPRMFPKVDNHFEKEWKHIVSFCLEQTHYNLLVAKLFDILALGNTKKVGFLTPDGSPHCIQLHFASKYLKRGMKNDINFEHFVVKKGDVYSISLDDIDKSKDLSLVGQKIKILA